MKFFKKEIPEIHTCNITVTKRSSFNLLSLKQNKFQQNTKNRVLTDICLFMETLSCIFVTGNWN